MALSSVPNIDFVSRSIKESVPCKGCQDREVGCHGKCEKYKAYHELLIEDRKKRVSIYAPEQIHENYCRKLHDKIVKRHRNGGR